MTAADPIRIVPVRVESLAPAAAPRLTYRGGPLLSSVQVFAFFWGDAWSAQAALTAELDSFLAGVVAGGLIDQLSEYAAGGSQISRGSFLGTATVAPSPPASVGDAEVRAFISGQLAGNAGVPQPTPNTLYFVFLPPGVTAGLDGASSCVNFCGYHNDVDGRLFYAVMPYPDCGGCEGGMSVLDALTTTSSHELCEAVTDPVPGQGWYDDQNGEIGDICAWQTKKLDGFTVQLEWSNRQGRCV